MTYDELKQKFVKNKPKIVAGVCFVLVFFLGFGTGKVNSPGKAQSQVNSSSNYTTKIAKPADAPAALNKEAGAPADAAPVVAGSSTAVSAASAKCVIKGNISAGGKIYHVPGGALYKIVKPEQCFSTEAEAVAAGFRKSGR